MARPSALADPFGGREPARSGSCRRRRLLELALASTTETRERAVSEYTDLLYALVVLAIDLDLTPAEIVASLAEKKVAAAHRPG